MYIPHYDIMKSEPKIIIFSGAGLSAESGISTFRDSNGLWENFKIEEITRRLEKIMGMRLFGSSFDYNIKDIITKIKEEI